MHVIKPINAPLRVMTYTLKRDYIPNLSVCIKKERLLDRSFFGAADRIWTDTTVTSRDFKSLASACSATAARYYGILLLYKLFVKQNYSIFLGFFNETINLK